MPKLVWLNGHTMPLETAVTSVADHAHLYGDGLFEGIRIYGGKVFKLDEHLARLFHGCHYMGFKMSMTHEVLKAKILEVCTEAGITDGYIRLNVSRGTGLGLDPAHINPEPNVMIMVNTLALFSKEMYETGLKTITSSIKVIPADALDPRLKCIGRYAANIMAKQEANRAGVGEAIMLNHQGYVAEGTGDNLFMVKDGVVMTPHVNSGILQGITRNTALGIARDLGYETREDFYTRLDILMADECFLTGTAAEIIPMISIDGQAIGNGKPGPITRQIMAAYAEATKTGDSF